MVLGLSVFDTLFVNLAFMESHYFLCLQNLNVVLTRFDCVIFGVSSLGKGVVAFELNLSPTAASRGSERCGISLAST